MRTPIVSRTLPTYAACGDHDGPDAGPHEARSLIRPLQEHRRRPVHALLVSWAVASVCGASEAPRTGEALWDEPAPSYVIHIAGDLGGEEPIATPPVDPEPVTPTVADVLRADGEAAARVAEMIQRLAPATPRERVYEISLSVARWSRVNGIRPELLTALIWHESRFDPNARSQTGDHGLCQLHGRAIYDIDANVRAGAAHLAGAIRSQGGDEARALAVYNGGGRGPSMGVCRRYAREVLEVAR